MAKTILIVDDSASLRKVLCISLQSAGYEVIEACDGIDALAKIDSLGSNKIHLIVSDVNMPNMDGIAFLKAVKQNPVFKFTPVIMLTTEGQDETKNEGRAAGAKAWIIKPFNPPQLLNAVQKLILP